MRLSVLALLCVAAVSYCEAFTYQTLIMMAAEAGADFTTEALKRLDNWKLWGAKRSRRSIDLVIINKSEFDFKRREIQCSSGSPSPGLLAESNLDGRTSSVLGFQSFDDDEGAYINCGALYNNLDDNLFIQIDFDPEDARGYVRSTLKCHPSLECEILGDSLDMRNNNNQVVVHVEYRNKHVDPLLMLSQQGVAPVRQRKPMGSRNMFVKASKRGTSVRTI